VHSLPVRPHACLFYSVIMIVIRRCGMALCGHVRAALIPVQDALSALLAETALETGRDTL